MVEESQGEQGRKFAEQFIQGRKKREVMEKIKRLLAEEKLTTPKNIKEAKKEIKLFKKAEKKQQQGREALANLKYQKSVGGRLQGIAMAMKSPTKTLYGRRMTLQQRKILEANIKKMQQVRARLPQRVMVRQPIPSPQNDFDWIFSNFGNPRTDMASQVEREINGLGRNGFATDGDRMANQIGDINQFNNPFLDIERQVNRTANIQHISPIFNIEQEVRRHSNLMNINPSVNVDREVNFFSNLLR